jgi:hypothetical protein
VEEVGVREGGGGNKDVGEKIVGERLGEREKERET